MDKEQLQKLASKFSPFAKPDDNIDPSRPLPPPSISPFYRFVNSNWTKCDSNSEENKSFEQFTLLTWNLDAQKHYRQQRYECTLKLLQEYNADFVCLQEVEVSCLMLLLKNEWIQSNFYVTDIDGATLDDGLYGTCILTKFKPRQVFRQVLPSEGKRKALITEYMFNGKTTRISTAHCDGGERAHDANIRQYQLKALSEQSSISHDAFFTGDLNIYSDNELEFLSSEFSDCWKILYPNLPGYTFDTQVNPWCNFQRRQLLGAHFPEQQNRFDRIFMKETNSSWCLTGIEIVGKTPIMVNDKNQEVQIFPSDHLGLLAKFSLKK